MKILFICSGNSNSGINIVVKNQGDSLQNEGLEINYLTINGKGFRSYLKNVPNIRNHLKRNKYDIIHAHYSFSAFAATLAGCRPLVVSLMGSDAYSNIFFRSLIRICSNIFWNKVIVKSKRMKELLRLKKCHVIPNGVNLDMFKPIDKIIAREQIGLKDYKRYILFAANPLRPEKNYKLAKEALAYLKSECTELLVVSDVPNFMMPLFYSASDLLLVTSLYEGSVNVVKEGMACNIPIVSTDVGDVKDIISSVSGCFICPPTPDAMARGIDKALQFGSRTYGRQRISELELQSENIAMKLKNIYESIL